MSDIAAGLTWTNIRFLLEGRGLRLVIGALSVACSLGVCAAIFGMR